ncbi:hypothetical protein [Methylobacterium trifolii]|uniref:hypothetical protein n=1 Tax=Methylobacterium trifolii TaxID=1003092 RepID=UPI001EDF89E6|nr:hypothetical protein [Methylobacterium trifolii]
MKRIRYAALGACFWLAGCAIHPLPEDSTGLSTFQIVRQIRCETRQAIIESALDWLSTSSDPAARRLGQEFRDGIRPVQSFHYNLFRGDVRKILQLFFDTGVAYNYSLEMTEVNNVGAGINLLQPFTNASGTLGLSASADRQRQNLRTFTITDAFSKLIRSIDRGYCADQVVGENYAYPISGRIGMKSVVKDFIDLTLFANLGGPADKVKGPPTLVDALDFQTTLSVSAFPKIVFSPVGRGLSVLDASANGTASRKDVHRVIVGLALPETGLPAALDFRRTLVGPLLTARGDPSELVAANAVNQVLTRQVLRPVINITP